MNFQTFGYALIGGIVPALIWLYFLLKEDAKAPEPLPLIWLAFLAGMLAVPLALPLESLAVDYLPGGLPMPGFPVILAWAAIEETLKYVMVAALVLWRSAVDEPIDLVIYLLTAGLGFAALENALFLVGPLSSGSVYGSSGAIALGDLRFIGSTLLHVVSSSTIGFTLAFTYRKAFTFLEYIVRAQFAATGLILAITLHAIFNFFIIQRDGVHTLLAFFIVWTGVVFVLALFEVLKYLEYRSVPTAV